MSTQPNHLSSWSVFNHLKGLDKYLIVYDTFQPPSLPSGYHLCQHDLFHLAKRETMEAKDSMLFYWLHPLNSPKLRFLTLFIIV